MDKILVSGCLLGQTCRWDGKLLNSVLSEAERTHAISICPEIDGGLACPRPRAEIVGGDGFDVLDGRAKVIDNTQIDVTAQFIKGAQSALSIVIQHGIIKAILKEKSPSCGVNFIYRDGRLAAGSGVTAALLKRHKIELLAK